MVDYNTIYSEHPMYAQFVKWSGIERNSENYFMINSALHGATQFIKENYEVNILATIEVVQDTILDGSLVVPSKVSKILTIIQDDLLQLPSTTYYNPLINKFTTVDGYITNNNGVTLGSNGATRLSYLTGYVLKDDITFDTQPASYHTPLAPIIQYNNTRLSSVTYTLDATLDVTVIGTPNSTVIINETTTDTTLDDSGEATISLDNSAHFTTYRIGLAEGQEVSLLTNITLIRQEDSSDTVLTLIGANLVTNTNKIDVVLWASKAGTLHINNDTTIDIDKGINKITVDNLDGTFIVLTLAANSMSVPVIVPYLLVDYSDELVEAINNGTLDIPYMPMDLAIAFFRLVSHLYQGTLFKNDNVGRYSAGGSMAVSYTSHRIPKDILNTIHSYVVY
jgi:hypothetical protein